MSGGEESGSGGMSGVAEDVGRRGERFSKYVGRWSEGCIMSQKIGGITITVHELNTEYHL
jgi:hypothetical protein